MHPGVLTAEERVTQHRDLGQTRWFTVGIDGREANHAAWEYTSHLPGVKVTEHPAAIKRWQDAGLEVPE